jgi:hypothetical protein
MTLKKEEQKKSNEENEISLRKTNFKERAYLKKLSKELRRQKYTFHAIREIKIKALIQFRELMKLEEKEKIDSVLSNSLKLQFGTKFFEDEDD